MLAAAHGTPNPSESCPARQTTDTRENLGGHLIPNPGALAGL